MNMFAIICLVAGLGPCTEFQDIPGTARIKDIVEAGGTSSNAVAAIVDSSFSGGTNAVNWAVAATGTNIADIATNSAGIATNARGIAANAKNIATNAADIAANRRAIEGCLKDFGNAHELTFVSATEGPTDPTTVINNTHVWTGNAVKGVDISGSNLLVVDSPGPAKVVYYPTEEGTLAVVSQIEAATNGFLKAEADPNVGLTNRTLTVRGESVTIPEGTDEDTIRGIVDGSFVGGTNAVNLAVAATRTNTSDIAFHASQLSQLSQSLAAETARATSAEEEKRDKTNLDYTYTYLSPPTPDEAYIAPSLFPITSDDPVFTPDYSSYSVTAAPAGNYIVSGADGMSAFIVDSDGNMLSNPIPLRFNGRIPSGKVVYDLPRQYTGTTTLALTKDVNTALLAKADKATTIAGYGITNAYTKQEVDAICNDVAKDATDYTDSATNGLLRVETDPTVILSNRTLTVHGSAIEIPDASGWSLDPVTNTVDIAIGMNSATERAGVAIGQNAVSDSAGVAIGNGADARDNDPSSVQSCVAIGNGAMSHGGFSVALGSGAEAWKCGTVVGQASWAHEWGLALGKSAFAINNESMVLNALVGLTYAQSPSNCHKDHGTNTVNIWCTDDPNRIYFNNKTLATMMSEASVEFDPTDPAFSNAVLSVALGGIDMSEFPVGTAATVGGLLAALVAAYVALKKRMGDLEDAVGTANADLEDALGEEA